MPQPYILKPGGAASIPDRVVFVDTEPVVCRSSGDDRRRTHRLGVGVADCCYLSGGSLVDCERLVFTRQFTFWAWLDEVRDRHKATWVFAHNLGYDLTLLGFWDMLTAGSDTLVTAVLEDPPTILTIRRQGKLLKFVDVLNYWRLSVTDLACGLSSPHDEERSYRDLHHPDADHCCYHVEVIKRCILNLIATVRETSLCSLRTTAASLSWGAFVKCFLGTKLRPHGNAYAKLLERKAYFGGRVGARSIGFVPEPVTILDANSLYPSVMLSEQYPTDLFTYTEMISTGDLRRALEDFCCVAHVDLCNGHPMFPRQSVAGVSYSDRAGTFYLAGPELVAAYRAASVKRVYAAALYHRSDLFSGFVTHFYRLKTAAAREGNKPLLMLWKMFLNCLHGKFAQRGRKWVRDRSIVAPFQYGYWWHHVIGQGKPIRCRVIAGVVERRADGPEPTAAFPAVAATCTAAARCVLANYLDLAGSSNALYWDTDSVHTLAAGRARLAAAGYLDSYAIGKLKEVCSGADAYYWGHQHYRVGNHFVCSAIKPTALQVADGVFLQDARAGVESVLQSQALNEVSVVDRVIDTNPRGRHVRPLYDAAASVADRLRQPKAANSSSNGGLS